MKEQLGLSHIIEAQRDMLTRHVCHEDDERIIPLVAVKERKAGLGQEQLIGYAISNDSLESVVLPTGPMIVTPIIQWQGEKLAQELKGKADVLPVTQNETVIGWRVCVYVSG